MLRRNERDAFARPNSEFDDSPFVATDLSKVRGIRNLSLRNRAVEYVSGDSSSQVDEIIDMSGNRKKDFIYKGGRMDLFDLYGTRQNS